MNWSKYQQGAFDFDIKDHNGLLINAVAGSGKSTVIEECIRRQPPLGSIGSFAFNVTIKDEMKLRLADLVHVDVRTLNGLGYLACREGLRKYIKIDRDKVEKILRFDVLNGVKDDEDKAAFYQARYWIVKMVGLCQANMLFAPNYMEVFELADRQGIDMPTKLTETQLWGLFAETYRRCWEKTNVMSFDDQIAMPLYYNWDLPIYTRMYIDETQDLTTAQIELVNRAKAICTFVGDPYQSIYSFRGADRLAIAKIRAQTTELPLSVCYRCAKAIVRDAQQIVPHIEYWEGSPEGICDQISRKNFKPVDGDVVLCRTTAPLVKDCLARIRAGLKATVKGRDIGDGLISLLDEDDRTPSAEMVLILESKGPKGFQSDEARMARNDKVDTIKALAEQCATVGEIRKAIKDIFDDNEKPGVLYSTIHKAKGCEWDRGFLIHPELIPHKLAKTPEALEQERNLDYVWRTRFRKERYTVV